MRYKIIDVYKSKTINAYIAKCLKQHSPQFIIIESARTLCVNLDIIEVNHQTTHATWITGEEISLKILTSFDHFDKTYMS